MSPTRIGVGLAALVAGPPLYALVQRGDIDLVTALQRGGVVAAGCFGGAWVVMKIVDGYARAGAAAARARRKAAISAALAELEAAPPDEGTDPQALTRPRPGRAPDGPGTATGRSLLGCDLGPTSGRLPAARTGLQSAPARRRTGAPWRWRCRRYSEWRS